MIVLLDFPSRPVRQLYYTWLRLTRVTKRFHDADSLKNVTHTNYLYVKGIRFSFTWQNLSNQMRWPVKVFVLNCETGKGPDQLILNNCDGGGVCSELSDGRASSSCAHVRCRYGGAETAGGRRWRAWQRPHYITHTSTYRRVYMRLSKQLLSYSRNHSSCLFTRHRRMTSERSQTR